MLQVVTRPVTQFQTVTSTRQQVVNVPVTQVSYVTQVRLVYGISEEIYGNIYINIYTVRKPADNM